LSIEPFSPTSLFWSPVGALLATPIVAYFADRQIVAACCENGPDYLGMLALSVLLVPLAVLLFSPVMIAGSGLVYAAVGPNRPWRVVLLLAFFGSLIGAALAFAAFAGFPPIEETAYSGMNGIFSGALTGVLASLGWWWGIRRSGLDDEAADWPEANGHG
jgi:hypothetical protein